jgi:cation:H+ antiporter
MFISIAWLFAGLAVLVVAGDKVVDFVAALARWARIPAPVVALTVIAAGTSLPELLVSANAAWDGSGGIAVGNVLGSNTFNVGFILGLMALMVPVPTTRQVLRVEWPFLVVATGGVAMLQRDGLVDRPEGAFLLVSCVAFLGFSLWYARRVMPSEGVLEVESIPTHPGRVAVGLALAFLALGFGARWFVDGAAGLARELGWSERVIGLTVVSGGTGAPEVVASIIAARKGRHDMAVANVMGSNLFNLLGILGVAALVRPLAVPDLGVDVAVTLAFALVLGPILWFQKRITRSEGALLLGAWGLYTAWLIAG